MKVKFIEVVNDKDKLEQDVNDYLETLSYPDIDIKLTTTLLEHENVLYTIMIRGI